MPVSRVSTGRSRPWTPRRKQAWLDSLRLEKPWEGRDEFFETHWQRMGDLYRNPYLAADALLRNMQAFADEGLMYLESMIGVLGFIDAGGADIAPDAVADIYRAALATEAALATGVTVRLQVAILRFLPDAEQHLRFLYDFAFRHRDLFVAVNMVGREDNDKGYPCVSCPRCANCAGNTTAYACRFTAARSMNRTAMSAIRCCSVRTASATASISSPTRTRCA
jgi:hypothetical protein